MATRRQVLHIKPCTTVRHTLQMLPSSAQILDAYLHTAGRWGALGRAVCAEQSLTGVQVEFEKPSFSVDVLMKYGRLLVDEQENVRRVQLADQYLSGAELAGVSGKSMPDEIIKEVIEDLGEEKGRKVIEEMEKKAEATKDT